MHSLSNHSEADPMTTIDAFYQNEQTSIIGSAIHDIDSRLDEIETEVLCRGGIIAAKLEEQKLAKVATRFLNLMYAVAVYRGI